MLIDDLDPPIREVLRKYPEGEESDRILSIFKDFYISVFKNNQEGS